MTTYPARRVMAPAHPGELIDDLFEANGLKVSPTAALLGVSRQQLHRVLKGAAPVTPSLAARLGKLFGNGPRLWLNMQAGYDAFRAEQDFAREIRGIPTLAEQPAL